MKGCGSLSPHCGDALGRGAKGETRKWKLRVLFFPSCDIVLARRCFGCFQKPSVVGYDVSFLTYPQERAKHDAIGDACDIFDFVP